MFFRLISKKHLPWKPLLQTATMLTFTPAEERIMLILWKIEPAKLNDIIHCFPDPKPANNTISTMLGTLLKKGIIVRTGGVRSYTYSTKLSKLEYSHIKLKSIMLDYFDGDFERLKKHVEILQY